MDWTLFGLVVAIVLAVFIWKWQAFVPSEKARQLLRQGALVVDVRQPGEFNSGHLPGAINIPLGDLKETLPRRIPQKNQVLLLHCFSGGRSALAERQLKKMGYPNAFNLGSYGRAQRLVQSAHTN